MLSSKNKSEATVKIVDFGCAHVMDHDDHTEHRGTGLTPAYCPPEVLGHKKRNPHSHCDIAPSFDMWSLG
jgi:serine/threonine protein kinase